MKFIIQRHWVEQQPKKLDASLLVLKETNIKINELKLGDESHLIHFMHSSLNTLIDFSKSRDYQILYYNDDKRFMGAAYAVNNSNGNFLIQTQAKWVVLIPFENKLKNDALNKLPNKIVTFALEYDINKDQKEEIEKILKEKYPLTRHTAIGMLYTTVRRMSAEKEFNIPISWRIGFAKSVRTGKSGNEMNESEWYNFYNQLCENLKRDNPTVYEMLFPHNNAHWN